VTGSHLAATYDRVASHLVGRERELTLMLAAVAAGRDLILEGPPGPDPRRIRSYTDVAPALSAIFAC
jgi:hypothetical protein